MREQLSSPSPDRETAKPESRYPPVHPGLAPLCALLDQLQVQPQLKPALSGIRRRLEVPPAPADGGLQLAGQIAVLLNHQRETLQQDQARTTALMQQLSTRLDEMARHLTDEIAMREAASGDSSELDSQVRGEVREIDSSIRRASSLAEAQQRVSSRIALIGEHLLRFRERETERLDDYKGRADRLRKRVDELERETSELQERVQREHQRASTDVLTGIPNRLSFEQRVREEQIRARDSCQPLCIALWDIDHFKSINDRYGHAAGDKALRVVAQHLARGMQANDFIARYGGEEFVAILRGMDVFQAAQQADRLRESLGRVGLHFDGQSVSITASCGISDCAPDEALEVVLKRADAALYRAKKAGRNRCFVG